MLRRYTFGTQPEHFAVVWLGDPDTPGETANPVVYLIPAERGLAPDRLQTEPPYTEVSLTEYHQWQHQGGLCRKFCSGGRAGADTPVCGRD
jgi:hypothetical protein